MESIPVPRPPAELPTEAELMSTWHGDPEKPLVTVLCTTFNHERFIRDAIHGFLMQRTTFPFRVVIHDDASTDRTAVLVKDYEARYPKIIKGVYQKKNLYSNGLSRRPFVKPLLLGKYIARCEGDDYWSDSLKLHKQIEFMELNRDYAMSFHPFIVYDDTLKQIIGPPGRISLTATLVYRNVDLDNRLHIFAGKPVINGDRVFKFLMWRHGKSAYLENIGPAIYRHHSGGIWSKRDKYSAAIEALRTNLYLYYEIAQTQSEKRWAAAEVARCLVRLVVVGTRPGLDVKTELQRSTTSLYLEFWRSYPLARELRKVLSRMKARVVKRGVRKEG